MDARVLKSLHGIQQSFAAFDPFHDSLAHVEADQSLTSWIRATAPQGRLDNFLHGVGQTTTGTDVLVFIHWYSPSKRSRTTQRGAGRCGTYSLPDRRRDSSFEACSSTRSLA